MNEFVPLNELEKNLVAAKENKLPVATFIYQLAASDVALPSAGEVQGDGSGFQPVFFDKGGIKMLAVFSDKTRVVQLQHIAKYCLIMNALEMFKRIPPKHGVVINPGLNVGLDISPEGIAQILKDMT